MGQLFQRPRDVKSPQALCCAGHMARQAGVYFSLHRCRSELKPQQGLSEYLFSFLESQQLPWRLRGRGCAAEILPMCKELNQSKSLFALPLYQTLGPKRLSGLCGDVLSPSGGVMWTDTFYPTSSSFLWANPNPNPYPNLNPNPNPSPNPNPCMKP